MSARAVKTIDASALPEVGFDTRSPLWWGNLVLLLIETAMFGILVASYFYVRINFDEWPPPRVDRGVHILDPYPGLVAATANMALLLVSILTMWLLDRAARRVDLKRVRLWISVDLLVVFGCIVLRAFEFPALKFKWNDNAYASVAWTLLGMHLLHLIVAAGETFLLAVWVWRRGLDEKHAMDTSVTAVYWYWIVAVWVPIYVIIYWVPRFLYTGPRLF